MRIAEALEITDLLWQTDADGNRLPVVRADAVSRLAERGQRRAARIIARMPDAGAFWMKNT